MSEMKKEEPREMNLVPTEKKERRTEFSKTYTVAPGKYQAFTSVIPLHRKNKETGKWDAAATKIAIADWAAALDSSGGLSRIRENIESWKLSAKYTANSPLNHCYVRRPVDCKDPFWCFWADGNADAFSISHLFFADSKGNVFRLPYEIGPEDEWVQPEKVEFDFSAEF